MSAVLYELRPFQSAVQQAQRVGVPRDAAVHAVAQAQREGASGHHVAGQLRHMAMRQERPAPTGPEAA